jgi:hypothetical protein
MVALCVAWEDSQFASLNLPAGGGGEKKISLSLSLSLTSSPGFLLAMCVSRRIY